MLRFFLFLLINLAALGLGALLMGDPSTNAWYQSQFKAPWTPPNWFFGVAWTTIMVCYAVFLWRVSTLYSKAALRNFYTMYALQFVLNVLWNPVFFRWHYVGIALVIIVLLAMVVLWFTLFGFRRAGTWGMLMLPYLLWLCVAISLNAYILGNNS